MKPNVLKNIAFVLCFTLCFSAISSDEPNALEARVEMTTDDIDWSARIASGIPVALGLLWLVYKLHPMAQPWRRKVPTTPHSGVVLGEVAGSGSEQAGARMATAVHVQLGPSAPPVPPHAYTCCACIQKELAWIGYAVSSTAASIATPFLFTQPSATLKASAQSWSAPGEILFEVEGGLLLNAIEEKGLYHWTIVEDSDGPKKLFITNEPRSTYRAEIPGPVSVEMIAYSVEGHHESHKLTLDLELENAYPQPSLALNPGDAEILFPPQTALVSNNLGVPEGNLAASCTYWVNGAVQPCEAENIPQSVILDKVGTNTIKLEVEDLAGVKGESSTHEVTLADPIPMLEIADCEFVPAENDTDPYMRATCRGNWDVAVGAPEIVSGKWFLDGRMAREFEIGENNDAKLVFQGPTVGTLSLEITNAAGFKKTVQRFLQINEDPQLVD